MGRAALIAPAAVAVALAGCGSSATTEIGLRNDLSRPVQVGLCKTTSCRTVRWWIGIDPRAVATEAVESGGDPTRFLVVGPPDTVYGCLVFDPEPGAPAVTVPLSSAHGCGSGR